MEAAQADKLRTIGSVSSAAPVSLGRDFAVPGSPDGFSLGFDWVRFADGTADPRGVGGLWLTL